MLDLLLFTACNLYRIEWQKLCSENIGTEEYVFQNRSVPCNYQVWELFWCAGVVVYNCLLVVSICLLVFCSHLFVVCGHLWSFAGGLWSFVMVCGRLLVVCSCFWWFIVIACFSNCALFCSSFFSFVQYLLKSIPRELEGVIPL